jgi:hypothetical protein
MSGVKMVRTRVLVGTTIALTLIMTQPAWAYLDPSAGSMMLQLLLGGIAGAAVALKLFWGKLLSLFGRTARRREAPEGADPEISGGA